MQLPAKRFCIKIFVVSMVDDDDVMMFRKEEFQSSLRVPRYITFIGTFLCCPPEPVTLAIFSGKYQQNLQINIITN